MVDFFSGIYNSGSRIWTEIWDLALGAIFFVGMPQIKPHILYEHYSGPLPMPDVLLCFLFSAQSAAVMSAPPLSVVYYAQRLPFHLWHTCNRLATSVARVGEGRQYCNGSMLSLLSQWIICISEAGKSGGWSNLLCPSFHFLILL